MLGLLIALALLGSLLAIAELLLRSLLGFGQPLLYQADSKMGYLLAPDQDTRRFGNRILVNQYSMRGTVIAPLPPAGTRRILLLGDSIVNGGWWTDQTATLSVLVQNQLNSRQQASQTPVEVLNASANSWGPRNELAYLQRFGTFGSQFIVLVLNTDDLFAAAPTSVPVGRDPNYPDRRPASALSEVFQRYLLKGKPDPILEQSRQEAGDRVARNLAAVAEIHDIAQKHNIGFLLLLTPLKRELASQGGSLDYEQQERQRLEQFCRDRQIRWVDFLPTFNAFPDPLTLYRDHIHLSSLGNELVTQAIAQALPY